MPQVTSEDGTSIAFDRFGAGQPLILVGGAFNDRFSRASGAPLATLLAPHFSVLAYDRRGRGGSSNTLPYAVAREVEDIAALIEAAGGSAGLYGISSGAILALEAAAAGLAITGLAVYEPPMMLDHSRPLPPVDLAARLADLVASGQRGDAVELFLTRGVGIPPEVVGQMRQAPLWPGLEALAHTLAYDATITGVGSLPTKLLGSVRVPTLAIGGADSPPFLRSAVAAVAAALPNAQLSLLPGQTHDVDPQVLAPVLTDFFSFSPAAVSAREPAAQP